MSALDVTTEAGAVTVSTSVPASVERVWQALTEPRLASKWFGELSGTLRQGGKNRLDFGDGDYFSIQDIGLNPHTEIRYHWRFLGVGPLDFITWRIDRQEGGCRATVIDREARRSPEWNEELKQGWTDFLRRLVAYIATGKPSRYDWRREADGGIELPCRAETAWTVLFQSGAPPAWLPWRGPLELGTRWSWGRGVSTFVELGEVEWDAMAARFELRHGRWSHPTRCRLAVTARGDESMLSFSHTGWEAISPKAAYQRAARKRFCGMWVASLQRARKLIASHA